MKIIMILIFLSSFINLSYSQTTEDELIKEVWGEINEHMTTHRGKEGLLLLDFAPDHMFKSFVSTCTGDNVLQKGNWEITNDTFFFDVVETKRYSKESNRNGKILATSDVGVIAYRIKEADGNRIVIERVEDLVVLVFERQKVNYMPAE